MERPSGRVFKPRACGTCTADMIKKYIFQAVLHISCLKVFQETFHKPQPSQKKKITYNGKLVPDGGTAMGVRRR